MSSLFYGVKFNLQNIYDKTSCTEKLLKVEGYKIYKITNLITNKCYIGDTVRPLYYRFHKTAFNTGHFENYKYGISTHLYNSMRKYGLSNFQVELLPILGTQDDELYYINKFNSYYGGYNLTIDGKGIHSGSYSEGKIWVTNGIKDHRVKESALDYYKSIGFDLGRSNLGENRIEILKSNKSWIYSPEYHVKAEESRRINNSGFHSMSASDLSNAGKNGLSNRRLSNGQLVIDYLNQNGLPIDELNWNTNRNKVGLSGIKLRFVPTYKTYLNLINNDKLI